MKRSIAILFFFLCCSFLNAQSLPYDSTELFSNTCSETSINSVISHINSRIDSTQLQLNDWSNTDFKLLKKNFQLRRKTSRDSLKFDSLYSRSEGESNNHDSLRMLASKRKLSHQIDSLKNLHLPADMLTRRLDSLNRINPEHYIGKVTSKAEDIQNKVNSPMDRIEDGINEKLSLMKQEGGDAANIPGAANLPGVNLGTDINIKNTGLPDFNFQHGNPLSELDNPLSNMNGLEQVKGNLKDVKNIPKSKIGNMAPMDELQDAKELLGNANELTDKAQLYGEDIKNISHGDLGEVKALPDTFEKRVGNMEDLKELQTQSGQLDQYKEMVAQGNDPEAMKELAKQQAISYATDHFVGKQEVLHGMMDRMSKLKTKYSEVSSLKDLPKRAPNPMKGKPFIERMVPGITFQIQKTNNLQVDFNPVVSYSFTDRLSSGVGWNERVSFADWNRTVVPERIYGPRIFVTYMLKGGFSLKAEGEKMNTMIPPFAFAPDAGTRQWMWSAFVGIKKDYKFMKHVKGNVQFLYNIYDDHDQSPYLDRLNVRMGFEFPIKKLPK